MTVELMMSGYSLETCSELPSQIFDRYARAPDGSIVTRFPTLLSHREFTKDDTIDFTAYGDAIIKEVDALTFSDRMNSLVRIYNAPEKPYRFIFPLKNVRGIDELKIGEVTIYSPLHKQFSVDDLGKKNEMFYQKTPFVFCNAIVELKSKDFKFSKEKAISTIESALDVLDFFSSAEGKPGVIAGNHCVLSGAAKEDELSLSAPFFIFLRILIALESDGPKSRYHYFFSY